eukprot:15432338-Alexandrium_andersonii.AAC.1
MPRGVLRRSPHCARCVLGSRLDATWACCGAKALTGHGRRAAGSLLRSPFGESCSCRHTGAMVDGRAALQP